MRWREPSGRPWRSATSIPSASPLAPSQSLQRPAIEPAEGEALPMPMRLLAVGDPSPANADRQPLRLLASLIAPFDVDRDRGAAREACAASHGTWSSSSCRLPGGRVYASMGWACTTDSCRRSRCARLG